MAGAENEGGCRSVQALLPTWTFVAFSSVFRQWFSVRGISTGLSSSCPEFDFWFLVRGCALTSPILIVRASHCRAHIQIQIYLDASLHAIPSQVGGGGSAESHSGCEFMMVVVSSCSIDTASNPVLSALLEYLCLNFSCVPELYGRRWYRCPICGWALSWLRLDFTSSILNL